MKRKKELKSVKIGLNHFNKVKKQKEVTGVPISIFIERAIDQRLEASQEAENGFKQHPANK